MRIGVIGCGYVGLVCGISFANMGHQVICSDISAEKITSLQSGNMPIKEQGLAELLQKTNRQGNITFTTDNVQTISESETIFITVGTPSLPDGSADLSYLWSAVRQIAAYLQSEKSGKKLIVVKSTVPVGTCDDVATFFAQQGIGGDKVIDVIHNPEFLRQGNAVHDFLFPDRIIIGCTSAESKEIMNQIYREIKAPIQFCDRRSAELIKYAANTFLAMKISYINMIACLSDKLGADISEVARGIGSDPRIGTSFLQAGIGYGGSCFPKDLLALLKIGEDHACELPLIEAVAQINNQLPGYLLEKLEEQLGNLAGKRIALLGLAYKPMTDDIREAPSLRISGRLQEADARIQAYDPFVKDNYPISDVHLFASAEECVKDCDAVIILTEWEEFKQLSLPALTQFMKNPLIVDGRNIFSIQQIKEWALTSTFTYVSVGRPTVS